MKLVHFAQLKADLPGQMREIADFLDIPIDEAKWDAMVAHCTFDYMKQHATKSVPLGGLFWDGGAQTFVHKDTNGRWREVLTAEESEKYERLALRNLGGECARWLSTGRIGS